MSWSYYYILHKLGQTGGLIFTVCVAILYCPVRVFININAWHDNMSGKCNYMYFGQPSIKLKFKPAEMYFNKNIKQEFF